VWACPGSVPVAQPELVGQLIRSHQCKEVGADATAQETSGAVRQVELANPPSSCWAQPPPSRTTELARRRLASFIDGVLGQRPMCFAAPHGKSTPRRVLHTPDHRGRRSGRGRCKPPNVPQRVHCWTFIMDSICARSNQCGNSPHAENEAPRLPSLAASPVSAMPRAQSSKPRETRRSRQFSSACMSIPSIRHARLRTLKCYPASNIKVRSAFTC
jgi:hypothetical protein